MVEKSPEETKWDEDVRKITTELIDPGKPAKKEIIEAEEGAGEGE